MRRTGWPLGAVAVSKGVGLRPTETVCSCFSSRSVAEFVEVCCVRLCPFELLYVRMMLCAPYPLLVPSPFPDALPALSLPATQCVATMDISIDAETLQFVRHSVCCKGSSTEWAAWRWSLGLPPTPRLLFKSMMSEEDWPSVLAADGVCVAVGGAVSLR